MMKNLIEEFYVKPTLAISFTKLWRKIEFGVGSLGRMIATLKGAKTAGSLIALLEIDKTSILKYW